MILATYLVLLTLCPGWQVVVDQNLEITEGGIEFIKDKEELVLFVYDDLAQYPPVPYVEGTDIVGTLTIGYGHTGVLTGTQQAVIDLIGKEITEEEAEKLFEDDLAKAQEVVNKRIKRHIALPKFIEKYGKFEVNELEDSAYDYLVITAFNRTGLNHASITGNLLTGNFDEAHAKVVELYGEQSEGINNRLSEQRDYLDGIYEPEEPDEVEDVEEPVDDIVEDTKEPEKDTPMNTVDTVEVDESKEQEFKSQTPEQVGPYGYNRYVAKNIRYQEQIEEIEKSKQALKDKLEKTYNIPRANIEPSEPDMYDRIKRTFSGKFG